jgi:hypothetical protein
MNSAHCTAMVNVGCSPTNTQVQVSKQLLEFAAAQAEWVRSNGLTQKSIAPGGQIEGAIMFRRDKKEKKGDTYIVRIPFANQVFEFPFPAPEHKTKF